MCKEERSYCTMCTMYNLYQCNAVSSLLCCLIHFYFAWYQFACLFVFLIISIMLIIFKPNARNKQIVTEFQSGIFKFPTSSFQVSNFKFPSFQLRVFKFSTSSFNFVNFKFSSFRLQTFKFPTSSFQVSNFKFPSFQLRVFKFPTSSFNFVNFKFSISLS